MLLRRFPIFDTRSAEAARVEAGVFGRMESFTPLGGTDRFHIAVNSVDLGPLRLSAVHTSGHRVQLAERDRAIVLMPWHGVLMIEDGRGTTRLREGGAMLPRPGMRVTTIPGPYAGLAAQVTFDLLRSRAALNPDDPWRPERDWPEQAAPGVQRYLRQLAGELDSPDTLLTRAPAAESAAVLFADLLLAGLAEAAGAQASPDLEAGPRHVRRAEEIIRARFHEALSIAGIAAAIGVSTRALQLAFRRRHGISPREYLSAHRLDVARSRLLAAARGLSVASVALDCGITHLGRFATVYRARFGESPSATLARAQTRE